MEWAQALNKTSDSKYLFYMAYISVSSVKWLICLFIYLFIYFYLLIY